MEKGVLLIVSGPSGVGKGSAVKKLVEDHDEICLSVSATTRNPRPGEVHGKDYFFIEKDEFSRMIKEKKILEYATYCENYYGTPSDYVDEKQNEGKDVILEIEVQGAFQVKNARPDAVMVFVVPPDMEVLRKRLTGRGTEDSYTISKRLDTAVEELHLAHKYDYIVINDDLDECVQDMLSIIKAEKCKIKTMTTFVDKLLSSR